MPETAELVVEGKKLSVSNLDKVLYPKVGFTKGQVIDYYIKIAPVLLPHLQDRPLTMKRYPNGVDKEFFYEKNCPSHRPKWVKTAKLWSEGNNRMMNYCLAQDLPTLVWAANLADLELHTSLSRKSNIKRQTMIVFDLDPGAPADIVQCCQVGLWLRDLLGGMKLKSLAKTSGSKGMQVYVPLNTSVTYDQTKDLSRALAQHLEGEHVELVESGAERESVPRLEPERRTQNHDLRLFAPRQGRTDRFNSRHLGGSRELSEKEKGGSPEIPLRSSPRSRRKNGRPLRIGRETQTKTAEKVEALVEDSDALLLPQTMVTILNARRVTRLPELGVQLIKLLDNGGLASAYRAKMDSAAVIMEQLEAALFVFICSCARLRSLSPHSKLSQRTVEDTVFAMIEAVDDGNRLVAIGECGLSDFEQSQVVIALGRLFGLQIPLIDGDLQSTIERYPLKFGELITARVHVGTAALAKALKAVSEKATDVGDQWHVALTEI